MGFLSKLWKNVKGVVKKVARTIKKVAKKIVTSLPGGDKLWKLGTKIGTKIKEGIGKFVSAIGPVGMIALSFVIGPAAGALWNSFGAGAAAMAGSANALVATLGNVGSGIFAAGNFISGTLGAVGEAIVGGAKNVIAGDGFGAALKTFSTNMSSALTGQAGMTAVNAGSAAAAASNIAADAGFDALATPIGTPGVNMSPATDPSLLSPIEQQLNAATVNSGGVDPLTSGAGINMSPATDPTLNPLQAQLNTATAEAQLGGANPGGTTETVDKDSPSSPSGEAPEYGGFSPVIPTLRSAVAADPNKGGGTGSSGFSLLSGVKGLEESLRASQRQMFA